MVKPPGFVHDEAPGAHGLKRWGQFTWGSGDFYTEHARSAIIGTKSTPSGDPHRNLTPGASEGEDEWLRVLAASPRLKLRRWCKGCVSSD